MCTSGTSNLRLLFSWSTATETEIFFAWMQRTTPTAQALPHGIGIQGGQGFYTMSSTVRGGAWHAGARARPQLLCRFVVWAQVVQKLDSSVSAVKVILRMAER